MHQSHELIVKKPILVTLYLKEYNKPYLTLNIGDFTCNGNDIEKLRLKAKMFTVLNVGFVS